MSVKVCFFLTWFHLIYLAHKLLKVNWILSPPVQPVISLLIIYSKLSLLHYCKLRWLSPPIPDGRCAASLEDILMFATGIDVMPAMSFEPPPSLSFFLPLEPSFALPQSRTETNHLILPLLSSYELFKKHLEYAVCQISVMQSM